MYKSKVEGGKFSCLSPVEIKLGSCFIVYLFIYYSVPVFVFTSRPFSGSAEGFTVRFGIVEQSNNLPYEVEVDISAIILHPEYAVVSSEDKDMALLRFAETVEFSDYVRPICLATDTDEMTAYGSGNCMAAGWGRTSQGNSSALCVFL